MPVFIKGAGKSPKGTAVVGDVLLGKTFSNDSDVGLTGTMTNNGAVAITPSTLQQTIPSGYHNGTGYVSALKPLLGDLAIAETRVDSLLYTPTAYGSGGILYKLFPFHDVDFAYYGYSQGGSSIRDIIKIRKVAPYDIVATFNRYSYDILVDRFISAGVDQVARIGSYFYFSYQYSIYKIDIASFGTPTLVYTIPETNFSIVNMKYDNSRYLYVLINISTAQYTPMTYKIYKIDTLTDTVSTTYTPSLTFTNTIKLAGYWNNYLYFVTFSYDYGNHGTGTHTTDMCKMNISDGTFTSLGSTVSSYANVHPSFCHINGDQYIHFNTGTSLIKFNMANDSIVRTITSVLGLLGDYSSGPISLWKTSTGIRIGICGTNLVIINDTTAAYIANSAFSILNPLAGFYTTARAIEGSYDDKVYYIVFYYTNNSTYSAPVRRAIYPKDLYMI